MKKIVLSIFLGLTSCVMLSQSDFRKGDTIYYKSNRYSFYRTNTFVVVKEENVDNQLNHFLVEKFSLDTVQKKIFKDSKFTSIGLNELRTHGLYTKYYRNGEKSVEGNTDNGQRIATDLWKYFYPNGTIKSEERLFPKSILKKIKYPMIVNFWNQAGEQIVTNGNGIYEYKNENNLIETGELKEGLKVGLWKATKNGQIQYEERYKKGKFVSGVSYDENGKTYAYKEIDVPASYKTGGVGVVRQHVVKNFSQNTVNATGNLVVWFDIDKEGAISNIRFIKRLTNSYNLEIERIITDMEGWKPALHRGQPVASIYKFSLNFK